MYERHAHQRIEDALEDTRVVLISGPRQAGKTTLAKRFDGSRTYLTLDDATIRDAAVSDPVAFVRGLDRAVIDEIQRAPDLLLAIKQSVDADPRPGRFLLTGSANLMTLPRVADSLAGRMEVVPLLPLSRSEIAGTKPRFLKRAFEGAVDRPKDVVVGPDLVEALLAGGYPEALTRSNPKRRRDWYLSYVDAVVQRDVRDVASIEQLDRMPRLLQALAEHSGKLVSHAAVGSIVGMNHHTIQKYTSVFEQVYFIRTLPAWHRNTLKRLAKTPKLAFVDSGLLGAVQGLTIEKLTHDRTAFGALLETFAVSEVAKLAGWADESYTLSHFRDARQNEVDLVIEDRQGNMVGVEVKAAASVGTSDFSGLRQLAELAGRRFRFGVVLYDHDAIVPFAENLAAAPISCLWN